MSALAFAAHDVRRTGLSRLGATGLVVQAQLSVRAPDDAFEREAERFASAAVGGGLVPGRLDELTEGVGGREDLHDAHAARVLGVVGGAADAGPILRSTAANPGSDLLGLEAGDRRIGGGWDFCPPHNTHVRA